MVSPDHRNTSHNQIKQPQSHMQDDQQLPCAPQALTDCMCFSSPAAITGSCRSVRDLGFRGSNVCQMSFGVCAAQISPLDILVGCCFFVCMCFVAHKPHFPFERLGLQRSMYLLPLSRYSSFVLHTLHPSVSCATDTNTQAKAFRFLLVISLLTFSAKTCSSVSVLSFGLNSPSVRDQAFETTDDFVPFKAV